MRLEEQAARLRSGCAVHHPHHGIGKVQSVGTRGFAADSDMKFAQMYFEREALTLILPVPVAAEAVRRPVDKDQARQVLKHIKRWDGKTSKQWKARANAHQEAMEQGDPFVYAEVFKGLCRLEESGSLRQNDRVHLNQAMDFLADELSFALDKKPDQVRELILEAAGK